MLDRFTALVNRNSRKSTNEVSMLQRRRIEAEAAYEAALAKEQEERAAKVLHRLESLLDFDVYAGCRTSLVRAMRWMGWALPFEEKFTVKGVHTMHRILKEWNKKNNSSSTVLDVIKSEFQTCVEDMEGIIKSMKEEDAKFRVFAETLVNALDGQKFRARNGIEYDVLSNYIQTISSLRDQVRAPYTGIRGVIIFQEILRDKNPKQFQIWLDDGYIAKDLKFHTDRALFFSESNAQKRYAELTTK